MSLQVRILVTVSKPELFESCTLCFDTLRVGFPTADIGVDINPGMAPAEAAALDHKIAKADAGWHKLSQKVHHAAWIREQVMHADAGPLIILDPDTIFWKSCEDWTFPRPLAGYRCPRMWNDFARCVSVPRLHTSFLWMKDPAELRRKIRSAYPWAAKEHGDYCPCDPFAPAVKFINGRPVFWDSTATLYNMVGGFPFTRDHLDCYDHLNSASFYDVMLDRLENKEGFAYLHNVLAKEPHKLRNFWPNVDVYYADKAREADAYLAQDTIPHLIQP